MRKTLLFILTCFICFTLFIKSINAQTLQTNDRSLFTYEINDLKFTSNQLQIKGWGLLQNTSHFNHDSGHKYMLVLESENHKLLFNLNSIKKNLNRLIHYRGYKRCPNNAVNKRNCNYDFTNVGFEGSVPLNKLKINQNYRVSLMILINNQKYKIITPIYYPNEHKLETVNKDKIYRINSSIRSNSIKVFYHTLISRIAPSPHADVVYMGNNCSSSYKNYGYFKQNTVFNDIKSIHHYNDDVTYFKVGVRNGGCYDQRRRLIEGNDQIAFIPSTFVNYTGQPLIINTYVKSSKPIIYANDKSIKQYTEFNPMEGVKAIDKVDGDLTSKIKVLSNNVNVNIPGNYKVSYSVVNLKGKSTDKSVKITVERVDTFFRYVNKHSLDFLIGESKLWHNKNLATYLYELLNNFKP